MYTLQLIDSDGKTILVDMELGKNEGQWDIFSEEEASMMIDHIRSQVEYPEEND